MNGFKILSHIEKMKLSDEEYEDYWREYQRHISEKRRQYNLHSRISCPETKRKCEKLWRKNHPEEFAAIQKRYFQKNREKWNKYQRNRRRSKK